MNGLFKKLIYYLLSIAFFIVFFMNSTSLIYYIKDFSSQSDKIYTENSTVIYPPLDSSLASKYLEDKWLVDTPVYFTEEDREKIEDLEYIKEVTPIINENYTVNSEYYSSPNSEEYYEVDKVPQFLNEQIVFERSYFPKEYYKYVSTENDPYILSGQYPEDNSNEIMINNNLANDLIEAKVYQDRDDILNENVEVAFKGIVTGEQIEKILNISGIYESKESEEYTIYLPYNVDDTIIKKNSPWLEDNADSCSNYELIYSERNIKKNRCENLLENEVGLYPAFMITVKDSKDLEKLYKEIKLYNPYIEVDNEYTQSLPFLNWIYIRRIFIIKIFYICLLILLELLTLYLYYKKKNVSLRNLFNDTINISLFAIVILLVFYESSYLFTILNISIICIMITLLFYLLFKRKMRKFSNDTRK